MTAGERRLDVSELEPPEPLVRTLSAAEQLRPGEYLRMLHRRDPCLLGEHLAQRGFAYLIRPGRQAAVETLIWRKGDHEGMVLAGRAANEPPA